jgi:hypothetical protein
MTAPDNAFNDVTGFWVPYFGILRFSTKSSVPSREYPIGMVLKDSPLIIFKSKGALRFL